MCPTYSKTILERAQELVGVSRSELIVATTICSICLCSLIYKWIANPADPLNSSLNSRVAIVIDSLSHLRDSLDAADNSMTDSTMNSNRQSASRDYRNSTRYMKKVPPKSPIDINTASIEELKQLPGVGETLAQRIVSYRTQKQFRRPEDLLRVRGFGAKLYAKIKQYIMVTRSKVSQHR